MLLARRDVRPWLAFFPGIFGWLQNEDGLMEWGSVALLILSAINAARLQKQSQQGWERLGWLLFFVLCCLFIGEEISWGERLHGCWHRRHPLDQHPGGNEPAQHGRPWRWAGSSASRLGRPLGWCSASEGLSSGGPLIPARRCTLYFTLPGIWYLGFEFCRKAGECLITVANHQEIYELLIIAGLYLHTRWWCRRRGHQNPPQRSQLMVRRHQACSGGVPLR